MEKNIQIKIKNNLGEYDVLYPKTKLELIQGLPEALSLKEDTAKKNVANGYAGLDASGKVPLNLMYDSSANKTVIVADEAAKNAYDLNTLKSGDRIIVLKATDGSREGFIYDGTQLYQDSDTDWANINIDWANITAAPTSKVSDIDDAVIKKHDHTNKLVLDKLSESVSNDSYDLSSFATKTQLNAMTIGADKVVESEEKQFVTATQKTEWTAKTKILIQAEQPTSQNIGDIWFEEVI